MVCPVACHATLRWDRYPYVPQIFSPSQSDSYPTIYNKSHYSCLLSHYFCLTLGAGWLGFGIQTANTPGIGKQGILNE